MRVENLQDGGYEEVEVDYIPCTVHVANLPPLIDAYHLGGRMANAGAVDNVELKSDRQFALVRYVDKVTMCLLPMHVRLIAKFR